MVAKGVHVGRSPSELPLGDHLVSPSPSLLEVVARCRNAIVLLVVTDISIQLVVEELEGIRETLKMTRDVIRASIVAGGSRFYRS